MTLRFQFDNSYARELEGFYASLQPDRVPDPKLVLFNASLAGELGLDAEALTSPDGVAVFSGNAPPEDAAPIAQAYAGHQFGGFSPQLGDGRAILLGEVIDRKGHRRDIQLKGSGRTPFSRGGDGKAALGPVLREYILGEAMHALGIPTTRALAAVTTGEPVMREAPLRGAILTRVAASHIRVGTFQFFAARGQTDMLRRLADYAIARHFPDLAGASNPYLALLEAVGEAQARLIAQWMNVGFIHGVMNTDNMAISGETIDYGPCAFMDHFDPTTVFSSIDTGGRYAYRNQPGIAQWNLARLAEALLALIDDNTDRAVEAATAIIDAFGERYRHHWLTGMCAKLGLGQADADLVEPLMALLDRHSPDFTGFFRTLAKSALDGIAVFPGALARDAEFSAWHADWLGRAGGSQELAARMDAVNPIYIARNHLVEDALAAADNDDLGPLHDLLDVLANPFTPQDGKERYALPAPESFGDYKTFCGT